MLRSAINGFDKIMEGEEPDGSIILVLGCPGSLKSTFMFTALSNHTRNTNSKGLYITLEQTKERHLLNLRNMGFESSPSVGIFDYNYSKNLIGSHGKSVLEFESIIESLRDYKKEFGKDFSCVAIDSMNALYALAPIIKDRAELYLFFEELRSLEVTTLIAVEMARDPSTFGLVGSESFVCDATIELGIKELEKDVTKRYLQVRKMRGVKHDMGKFYIDVSPGKGLVVFGRLL